MANTLPNIRLTNGQWVDIYSEAGIEKGAKIVVQNVGSNDVYLASSFIAPDADTDSYQIISPGNSPMSNSEGDDGAWAFSPNTTGKINVSLM